MSEDALPDVWVVIPHYGEDRLLQACQRALLASDYPADRFNEKQVLVINNNPPHENLLFTNAVNAGILLVRQERRRLGREGMCLIWVLNNDTEPEPGCMRAAAQTFAQQGWSTAGMVGPKNVRMDDPDRIFWGGSKRCYPSGKHKVGSVARGDLSQRTEEEWITFSSVFLNALMVEQVGLLDPNMRHVCSDADYCFRARAMGWTLYYEPAAVIRHHVGTSNRGAPPALRQVMAQDADYFRKKWVSPGELFRSLTQYPPEG